MERTILQQLKAWKIRPDRKPLILNGARQVGKTWILREFARQQYDKEAYIICRKNELARKLFLTALQGEQEVHLRHPAQGGQGQGLRDGHPMAPQCRLGI